MIMADISKLSIVELSAYEHAAKSVCSSYEKAVKTYDGTFVQDSEAIKKFEKYIGIYNKILNEIEKRIDTL